MPGPRCGFLLALDTAPPPGVTDWSGNAVQCMSRETEVVTPSPGHPSFLLCANHRRELLGETTLAGTPDDPSTYGPRDAEESD